MKFYDREIEKDRTSAFGLEEKRTKCQLLSKDVANNLGTSDQVTTLPLYMAFLLK